MPSWSARRDRRGRAGSGRGRRGSRAVRSRHAAAGLGRWAAYSCGKTATPRALQRSGSGKVTRALVKLTPSGSGRHVGAGEPAQLLQGLPLELTDPLGGDAVLGADVGELVDAAVDEAVARADDVGRAGVEPVDQLVEALARLGAEERG